jgi:ribosomal-protein-alanine N-acetyltransferase
VSERSHSLIRTRLMAGEDLDRVLAIAAALPTAPHWDRPVYGAAISESARRLALVAEKAGAISGFAIVGIVAPEAELESIAVAPEAQRSGIGVALVAELVLELRHRGVATLDLEVRESNQAAAAFYQCTGFREIGRRRGYFSNPVEDALLLRLELDDR